MDRFLPNFLAQRVYNIGGKVVQPSLEKALPNAKKKKIFFCPFLGGTSWAELG
jgi:hypothetical protein